MMKPMRRKHSALTGIVGNATGAGEAVWRIGIVYRKEEGCE